MLNNNINYFNSSFILYLSYIDQDLPLKNN